MRARTTNIQAPPSCVDAGIANVRDEVMPALAALDGFVGLSLLVDRESGLCIAASAWETEEAERSSAEQVGPLRERAAEVFGDVLPSLENLDGFCSASFLINRNSGRGVSTATFDSREAMDRNREQAKELRNTRTRELGADIVDVGEFDLAIAHLRVPEMA